ncbi:ABC transporter permease [Clostridium tepidum]|uniref:ABC transporter permease n=2 Tax=Clostridium tepidum TaxID=1962263 RepID=A0ABX3L6H1_9CLOT|nr:ABC transporter permease [Clostridium tepidum]
MRFKYALRGISRKFFYSFLIMFQLFFGFYSMYENINLYKKMDKETNNIEEILKYKNMYALEVQDVEDNSKYFKNIDKTIRSMENKSKYNFIRNIDNTIYTPIFDGYNQFQQYDYKWKINGKIHFPLKNFTINKKYLEVYPLKVKKGRMFNKNEFNFIDKDNSVVPILVGANFSKYFKVGDEIPIQGLKVNYKGKIIGILEKDQYNPGNIAIPDSKYINLNDYVISTDSIFESELEVYTYSLLNGTYISFKNDLDKNEINEELKNIKKAFNSIPIIKNAGIRDLSEYINQDIDKFQEQFQIVSITSISVIIFVCITFIISLLESIDKRKKEYGIHIMSGGKLSDIAVTTYMEVLMIFFITFLFTVSAVYYKYGHLLDVNTLAILFIIIILLSILSSIVPIVKIFKLNINELIKGDE